MGLKQDGILCYYATHCKSQMAKVRNINSCDTLASDFGGTTFMTRQ